jgi:hypothetical protein
MKRDLKRLSVATDGHGQTSQSGYVLQKDMETPRTITRWVECSSHPVCAVHLLEGLAPALLG